MVSSSRQYLLRVAVDHLDPLRSMNLFGHLFAVAHADHVNYGRQPFLRPALELVFSPRVLPPLLSRFFLAASTQYAFLQNLKLRSNKVLEGEKVLGLVVVVCLVRGDVTKRFVASLPQYADHWRHVVVPVKRH